MSELYLSCPPLADYVEEISEVAGYLWQKGWAECNGGNLSVDISHILEGHECRFEKEEHRGLDHTYSPLGGHYFLVTGSGYRFRDLARNVKDNACILRVDNDGSGYTIVWGGGNSPNFRPTSEFASHLSIHKLLLDRGSDERVVLHTHPTELIALTHFPEYKSESAIKRALWGMLPEVKVIIPCGVGIVPYALPGSQKLAEGTIDAFNRGHSVILWEMHGCLATGKDAIEAFDQIDTLNKAAEILLLCRAAGQHPSGISEVQLKELVKAFNLKE